MAKGKGSAAPRRPLDDAQRAAKNAHMREYYQQHKAERAAYQRQWERTHPEERRAQAKRHYAKHRTEILAKAAEKVPLMRGRRREYEHDLYMRTKVRHLELGQRWKRVNAARVNASARKHYAANPAKGRARTSAWRFRFPEAAKAQQAAHRALKAGAHCGDRGQYRSFVAWSRKAARVRCYWCGSATRPGNRHRDHIIPLAKGGADSVANLCISCPPCNQRKHAKLPEDFAGQAEMRFA